MAFRVYGLHNGATGEFYFGVTGQSLSDRVAEHCIERTKAIEHWDCARDPIEAETITWRKSRSETSRFAHALEAEAEARGMRVIRTAGI